MTSQLRYLAFCLLFCVPLGAQEPTRAEVIGRMQAYRGTAVQGVDATTLARKLMCGYQGWFTAEGDGSGRGWAHYARRGKFEPGSCTIDLWPDLSEFDDDEKYATSFRHQDGTPAYVFSSHTRKTVVRHFHWMQQYGIDGAFVQRFAVETLAPRNLDHCNAVLAHCREGANLHGRAYAVMYDLSGLRGGQMQNAIEDWKLLVDRMRIGRDPADRAYLRHHGRPLVAVWGIGFNDSRQYTLDECHEFVRFLKTDPIHGGCSVMVGVPTGWRTLDRDSVGDKKLHEIILEADIVSPWTVGRYDSPDGAARHGEQVWKPDLQWCQSNSKEYLPVVFPGFSWHNMRPQSRLDQIPRRKGEFLWSQFVAAKNAGASMIYQAMFDELDEGTAIFKCTNDPPVGPSQFVTYEGLPSDHYLWLVGQGGKLLRNEIVAGANQPARKLE